MSGVTLDLSLAIAPRVTGGVDAQSLQGHPRAEDAVPAVLAAVESGELGFWQLPSEEDLAGACVDMALRLRERFDQMVVLGIGGSSLGGRMLLEALADVEAQKRVRFIDNVDPVRFERMLADLDIERTCFNVISKSGGTVETAAQFVVLRDRLKQAFGDAGYAERMIATTDPEKGLMRDIANEDGLKTLPIPGNVGGRFSVLTAVGLLPAAFAGVDVRALLAGAQDMRARCVTDDVTTNPALALAALHHLADTQLGRKVHVVMPYADRLRALGEWYCQLWGESLGKATTRTGETVHVGPTPVVAVGSTDQHSQIQLYVEGPEDKLINFIAVAELEEQTPFPASLPEGYRYLEGHSMAGLFDAERRGTALALARVGRPSTTTTLERIDAASLGGLIFLWEAATAFAGELYDINAFDQPGVEMGKQIAYALMGRAGYDEALHGLEGLTESDPTWCLKG